MSLTWDPKFRSYVQICHDQLKDPLTTIVQLKNSIKLMTEPGTVQAAPPAGLKIFMGIRCFRKTVGFFSSKIWWSLAKFCLDFFFK